MLLGFRHNSSYQILMRSFLRQPAQKCKPKRRWELRFPTKYIQLFSTFITKTRACALQLQACDNVETLNQVHAQIIITGLHQNSVLGSKLNKKYAIHGYVEDAHQVFNEICQPNSFLWNTLIRGYARNGDFGSTLRLYYQLKNAGIRPDNFTFLSALKACGTTSSLQVGKEIHNHIIKEGFGSDAFVSALLVDMYAKCRELRDACKMFEKMSERDVVSWTTLIVGYAQNGHLNEALTLFYQMQLEGFTPDLVTAMSLVSACAQVGALQQGKRIHNYIIRSGFESDVSVMNSLVDMYAKCRVIEFACQLFERISERDVISWSAMISGCAKNGFASEALILLNRMQQSCIKPNLITMAISRMDMPMRH